MLSRGADPNGAQRLDLYRVQGRRESLNPQQTWRTRAANCARRMRGGHPRCARRGRPGGLGPGRNRRRRAGRTGRQRQQHRLRPPGDVGLVRHPLRGRQRRRRSSPAPSANDVGTVYIKAADGGGVWSQFSKGLVGGPAPRRARRLRLAVRLRRRPGRRGPGRRRGGEEGRRLLRDRRRGRLRGQVRRRRPLRPRAARRASATPSRSRSPASPTSTTTRPSPTRSSSGPGGATVQPAADVLEDDRHLGPRRLRAHLPLQPHLGPPDLPDRPDLRSPRQRLAASSSAASPPATAGCRRAGGTGRRPTARSGGRSAPTAPCSRSPATARKSSTRC